jgi:hypothetical protein
MPGTKFCTLAPNVCGSSVWNLLHCHPNGAQNVEMDHRLFQKMCAPSAYSRANYMEQSYLSNWWWISGFRRDVKEMLRCVDR